MPRTKLTPRFIGLCIIIILGVTSIGWFLFSPDNNVRIWLNKDSIHQGETLTRKMRNLGTKWMDYSYFYSIYRVSKNGTEIRQRIGPADDTWAFPACGISSGPFTSFSQDIYTGYESGKYYVKKEYSVNGVHYTRKLHFTIVG